MLVVVIAVHGMLVAFVHIIDVIAMLNSLVAAVLTMRVLGCGVLGGSVVLVVVSIVLRVAMITMEVVDVIAVLNSVVAAILAVLMFGNGVVLIVGGAHVNVLTLNG